MRIPYYHVDAFTDQPFSGNPAGVCLSTVFPPDAIMQRIAAENRHSETAFLVARPDREFDLRWFTPAVEDDLCGHATLATAFVLRRRGHDDWPVRFHTQSGVLTVGREGRGFVLDFPARPAIPCESPRGLLSALGLRQAPVLKSVRDYLVIVGDAEQVQSLNPDIRALTAIDMGIGGAIVTAAGTGELDYVCRFFPPGAGIDEDPATGSIQCTLGPYWASQLGRHRLRVRQLSPRGAIMECDITGDRVKIIGNACLYLEATIELPE